MHVSDTGLFGHEIQNYLVFMSPKQVFIAQESDTASFSVHEP